ncbi:MAG: hypothetical protein ACFFED_00770 [Candidatus Thorarchaeota archaeon]
MTDHTSDRENVYEDFVTIKPDAVKLLTKEQMDLAMENNVILGALLDGNMTVKEIHNLFWDNKKNEYSKTIKTIYRYLDNLEENGLVKVAGHRKPKDSRLTEKLYCRSAKVFMGRETKDSPKWYETEEGEEQLLNIIRFLWIFFDAKSENQEEFTSLIKEYYSERDAVIRRLLETLANNEQLADLMDRIGLDQIKSVAQFVGMIGSMLSMPGFQDSIRRYFKEN